MKHGVLFQPNAASHEIRDVVTDEIQRATEQELKVFRTFVPAQAREENLCDFVLLTTNKETHLGFGLFETREELRSLCHLVASMFKERETSYNQILLYKDMKRKKGGLSQEHMLVLK